MGRAKETKREHQPLQTQLKEDVSGVLRSDSKKKRKREDVDSHAIPGALSAKILSLAKEQQLEERLATESERPLPRFADADLESESDDWSDQDLEEEEEIEELEIDEADQAALDAFAQAGGSSHVVLSDLVMEKIAEHERKESRKQHGKVNLTPQNAKVVEAYTKVGLLLSRYKSGPLPKAFKILPTLSVWPSLLNLTAPEEWTPHAAYAATRVFSSNLDAKQSLIFYRDFLLPKIRAEIAETKKLAVQTYAAIKRSIYKPAAFFKGILFPLCESGTCTLREATIIGSIITRVSIPVLHSGAALLKLAEMDYTGPNSLFIRVLLDKKYALPYKVVDALVFHFLRFKQDSRQMPVLWHQSFLVFAQRYKADMTPEQIDTLLAVIKAKPHPQISAEIRRELTHAHARDEIVDVEMSSW